MNKAAYAALRCTDNLYRTTNSACGKHAHALAAASDGFVLDDAIDHGEERVVAARADVLSGLDRAADLANQDAASANGLVAIDLDSAHLRVGVAAVTARATRFLMCHCGFTLSVDLVDFEDGDRLAVAGRALVVLAALVLEDGDLLVLALRLDRRRHGRAGNCRLAEDELAAAEHEDIAKRVLVANVTRNAVDL